MESTTFEDKSQIRPLLQNSESDVETEAGKETCVEEDEYDYTKTPPKSRFWHILVLWLMTIALVAVAARALFYFYSSTPQESALSSTQCQNPSIRREWRTLSTSEKLDYLDAVVCLTKTPSVLGLNQTLFDDFPFIHTTIGKEAHHSALFLAWHRYFLHIYEARLRDVCHYPGSLVFVHSLPLHHFTAEKYLHSFFDWQLNIHDLPSAPIWDPVTGFGGDGNITGPDTVNVARCVTDGPFANLPVLYYSNELKLHCLSRGFQPPVDMERYYSARVSVEAIDKLMATPRYEEFNLGVEDGPHLSMPHAVLGDFLVDTAPNDPVFFLHHAQLDRLWWKWQKSSPGRLREYNGASARGSKEPASLQDQLKFGELAANVAVEGVMDTRDGLLCYEYAY